MLYEDQQATYHRVRKPFSLFFVIVCLFKETIETTGKYITFIVKFENILQHLTMVSCPLGDSDSKSKPES